MANSTGYIGWGIRASQWLATARGGEADSGATASAVPASERAYGPLQLAHKDKERPGVLAEAWTRAKRQRRVVGVDGRRRRTTKLAGEVDAGGTPGIWNSRSGPRLLCGGAAGVRSDYGPSAARNRGGGSTYPRRRPAQIRPLQVMGSCVEASGSLLELRRGCCVAPVGLGCGGAAWPRRRRGLFAAELCGGSAAVQWWWWRGEVEHRGDRRGQLK